MKNVKKADIILLVVIVAAAAVIFLAYNLLTGGFKAPKKGEVVITVDGNEYGRYALREDITIEINDTNRVIINDGVVDMEWADCPDKLCVNHIPIKRSGESIICLPNRVVVTIENSGEESEFDTLVQ